MQSYIVYVLSAASIVFCSALRLLLGCLDGPIGLVFCSRDCHTGGHGIDSQPEKMFE